MTNKEASAWFIANLPWLKSWLKKTKPSKAKVFQVFMRTRNEKLGNRFLQSLRHMGSDAAIRYAIKVMTESCVEEYVPMVLFTLVFGSKTKYVSGYEEEAIVRHTISGFLEQTGRLPTKKDKVILYEVEPEPQPIAYVGVEDVIVAYHQRFSRLKIL